MNGHHKWLQLGHGGGHVVSVLTFYSNDPSSNPTEVYSFCKICVWKQQKQTKKEAGVGPFFPILPKNTRGTDRKLGKVDPLLSVSILVESPVRPDWAEIEKRAQN